MSTDLFLSRLQGVRAVKPGSWVAKCPAHEDRSPSLSITTHPENGSPLFHCFTGCSPDDILAAIVLTWKDLYPDRWDAAKASGMAHGHRRARKMLAEITQTDYAMWVIRIAIDDKQAGHTHDLADRATLALAAHILEEARNDA